MSVTNKPSQDILITSQNVYWKATHQTVTVLQSYGDEQVKTKHWQPEVNEITFGNELNLGR